MTSTICITIKRQGVESWRIGIVKDMEAADNILGNNAAIRDHLGLYAAGYAEEVEIEINDDTQELVNEVSILAVQ